MSFIAIYITHSSEKEAQKLSSILLDRKLIACANIFPITSQYLWKGQMENDKEWVSIAKTQKKHWKTLSIMIEKLHPYTTPCIMKIKVKANAKYEKWIVDSTNLD